MFHVADPTILTIDEMRAARTVYEEVASLPWVRNKPIIRQNIASYVIAQCPMGPVDIDCLRAKTIARAQQHLQ